MASPRIISKHNMIFPNFSTDRSWTLFLDRDGVINRRLVADYVKFPAEFEWLPGSKEAIVSFSEMFGIVVVVTNQQGIGKGLMTENDLDEIHQRMKADIMEVGGHINQIYHCPDLASRSPNCRKPSPEMAWRAKQDFPQIDFQRSLMVGDSCSDMEFGRNAGMQTVFIQHPGERACEANYKCASLLELAHYLKQV